MSETKWTPGPWKVGEYAEYGGYDMMTCGMRAGPADLDGQSYGQGRCKDMPPQLRARMEADARLISAAPDMYDALDKFVTQYVDMVNSGDCGFWNPETEEFVKAARAALAKARGETP